MTGRFKFSARSKEKLQGVHPQLVRVLVEALDASSIDFGITEGVRQWETQKKYFQEGRSQTMKSYHLRQSDGFSHAVDVVAYVDGQASWELKYYSMINDTVQRVAHEMGVHITWGGSWETLVDGPHFQIEV